MNMENRKFLDLDHICDQIISQDDRVMFNEAIKCYQVGSHRAAIILAWCVTADCLYRRIEEMATEGDGVAQQACQDLKPVLGTARYEENLISQAKKCELFDDYEEKCLRFSRDTRSKCAHPTGVIPPAEAVRNILHICSQTVLCRDGYRGMAFIKHFVQTKLADRHVFSDKNRIKDTCLYYFGKVPDRIRPQFAACATDYCVEQQGLTSLWKSNALLFFKELLTFSSADMSQKIAQKFQPIESIDRSLFFTLVGIDHREDIWDSHIRTQAKAHLRDILEKGKVDPNVFHSYGNICSLDGLDTEDSELIKKRFAIFSDMIGLHSDLVQHRRVELLSLIVEGLNDETQYRQQVLNGTIKLVSGELFMLETGETVRFVEEMIESDWREEAIRELLLTCSEWTNVLKVGLLKKSERFFEECSEDFPEDIVLLFDVAGGLLDSNPSVLPSEFENSIKEIVDGSKTTTWFIEKGEIFHNFIGQVDLIRLQHGVHLPILSDLTLPELDTEEMDDSE